MPSRTRTTRRIILGPFNWALITTIRCFEAWSEDGLYDHSEADGEEELVKLRPVIRYAKPVPPARPDIQIPF